MHFVHACFKIFNLQNLLHGACNSEHKSAHNTIANHLRFRVQYYIITWQGASSKYLHTFVIVLYGSGDSRYIYIEQ